MKITDNRPIYLQIADNIRERILVGELKAGDQLMSTTQYATTYRINPATANKAFTLLVEEGIAVKRRGIGMFVTKEALDLLRNTGKASFVAEVLTPALSTGLNLGLSPSEILNLATVQLSTLSPKKES